MTSCRDKFAELNQDPSAVTTPEPSYLATTAMMIFEANDYTYWFYNAPLYYVWSQMGASGSYSENSYAMGAVNWQNSYISMLAYRNEIDSYIEANGKPELQAYSAMCGVLAVYGAIYASDINGDIQYTEAAQYSHGGTLTPAYDSVESLYDKLVADLDKYIGIFQDDTQVVVGNQDLIYAGNTAKWAKLANSLKLKIAVRLYNNNSTKATQIAQSVLSSPAGYLDSMDDSFIYHKADMGIADNLHHVMGDLDHNDVAYQ
ncbi:MAG: SusD/RagB family nutrient-binding outer membrane lipoprotein, partial [Erysipelotrichaceae bacterium]|nr:SusD/RagB family nutrient-binding outer membrane lipoprotein [Erysipelotrichaceae bacterium]